MRGAPVSPQGLDRHQRAGPRTSDRRPTATIVAVLRLSVDHLRRSGVAGAARGHRSRRRAGGVQRRRRRGHEFDLTQMLVPEKKVSRHGAARRRDEGLSRSTIGQGAECDRRCLPRVRRSVAYAGRCRDDDHSRRSGEQAATVPPAAAHGSARVVAQAAADACRGRARQGGPMAAGSYMRHHAERRVRRDRLDGRRRACEGVKDRDGRARQRRDRRDPASASGLRAGDVIVERRRSAGRDARAASGHSHACDVGERSVALQVVRDRKPRKVTVNW